MINDKKKITLAMQSELIDKISVIANSQYTSRNAWIIGTIVEKIIDIEEKANRGH